MPSWPRVDEHAITTLEQLRELIPEPAERALKKEHDRLDQHCREFIALSPFVVLSSSGRDGTGDVSPKGGPPGFVTVLDDHRLVIPDATGNRRVDSLHNILENPQVGLLFLIPGMRETLRVNGRAELTRDPALLEGAQTGGRPAAHRDRGDGRAGLPALRQVRDPFRPVGSRHLAR